MTIFVIGTQVAWASFLPRVLPFAPGVPDQVAEDAILQAAIDFCKRSRTWRTELPAFDIVANTATYTLASPRADAVISDVLRAELNGLDMPLKTPDQLDDSWPGWKTAQAFTPSCWHMANERQMRLVAIPTQAATAAITASVALKPAVNATTIDQTVFEEHYQAIADGALATLLAMPDNSWTDDIRAMSRKAVFNGTIVSARTRARKAYSATRAFGARPRQYGF